MAVYSAVAYGVNLDDVICKHYSITDKNLGTNSSFECFASLISDYIGSGPLICVDPDGRGISTIYYAVYKQNNSIEKTIELYNESIKNLDDEFDGYIREMDEIIADDPEIKEEFCYMIFDSPNYDEAKKRLLELKDIIREQIPDMISIQSFG